jgi:succinate-semialdehyde dehydrogenase/glutarate-semialdehyde dehydrogenase
MAIRSINPATGERLKDFETHDRSEIERRLALAASASQHQRSRSFPERAQLLMAAALIIDT